MIEHLAELAEEAAEIASTMTVKLDGEVGGSWCELVMTFEDMDELFAVKALAEQHVESASASWNPDVRFGAVTVTVEYSEI